MWFKACIKGIEKLPYENFLPLDILDWFLSYREHDISSTIFRQSVGTRLSKLKSIDWTWLKKNRCGNWRDSQFDSLSRSYLGRKEIVTEITISVFDSRIYIAAFLHGHWDRGTRHRCLHQRMRSAAFLSWRINYNRDLIVILSDKQRDCIVYGKFLNNIMVCCDYIRV